jgi:preprotein translocase subunit YajC
MWQMLLFYALIAGGFYFLFIAPQRKKQKAHEKMLSELQSGDEVLTTGGIYGVVTNVKEDRFIVRISDTTKVEIAKGFISSVTKRNGVEEKK